MKAIIADHQPMFRHSLGTLLREINKDILVFETSDMGEVDALIGQHADVGIVFLELTLGWGHQCLNEFLARQPATVNFAVLIDPQGSVAMRAIPLGVSGLISKSFPKACIEKACRLLLDGETFFPKELLRPLATQFRSTPAKQGTPHDLAKVITRRQLEVLKLLAEGNTNAEIAHEMGIAVNTVRAHVAAVLRTLGVPNRGRASKIGRAYFENRKS